MKTIVVSAVNLNAGGTLTILKDCLQYLSLLAEKKGYRIIALVNKKELAEYPNIKYIELQWPKKSWIGRLWCEYITMRGISKSLAPIDLWLSLHDTTPCVYADKRAVYCHNPFPFYKWRVRELLFTPKIVLFAIFSKWIYKININKNDYIIVQQQWIKNSFLRWFNLRSETVIIAPPPKEFKKNISINFSANMHVNRSKKETPVVFLFPATANSHKNFECLCSATEVLYKRLKKGLFEVYITVKGDENAYGRWLYYKWGMNPALNFTGFLNKQGLYTLYEQADCLVFPSKIETWGLPITEFASYRKPMLLADLSYAHETASECEFVSFFDPNNFIQLADKMEKIIQGNFSEFEKVDKVYINTPVVYSWQELFRLLLS